MQTDLTFNLSLPALNPLPASANYKTSHKRLAKLQSHNAKLAKDLADANKRITRLRFERGLLLDKLYEMEKRYEHLEGQESSDSEGDYSKEEWWREVDIGSVLNRNPIGSLPNPQQQKKPKRKRSILSATDDDFDSPEDGEDLDVNSSGMLFEFEAPNSNLGSSPPKKRRSNKASATDAVLKTLQVEYTDGLPQLPINVGVVTVEELGEIVYDRPSYHNRRYLLPVGYHSTRAYLSTVDPSTQTVYHSRILDGGSAPIFQVTPEDSPHTQFQAPTSTGAWSAVVRQANQIRSREYSNSASGPDYYGLSNATVAMLIEDLPNSERCINYQRKRFERGAAHLKLQGAQQGAQSKLKGNVDVESDQVNSEIDPHLESFAAADALAHLI